MRVERIALSGFRNYDEETADFAAGINVITGPNAQGKTNLLEAVWILTGARSFRTRFDRELIGFGSSWAKVLADVESGGRTQTVSIQLREGRPRQTVCNGAKRTGAEMGEVIKCVLFGPDDLDLIKEGAAARRKLMDVGISQLRPGYAALLTEYNRLYEHKTRILRDWREKPALLDTLDEFSDALCRCSARIIRYRAAFAAKLNKFAAPIHGDFSGGAEKLSLSYTTVSTVRDPFGTAEAIYYDICEHQEAHKKAELESGLCLTGAHKDDIIIQVDGRAARAFASQGQMRTAALSVKLAEREIYLDDTGEWPVLLLDDVLSELDAKRQEFVLNRIGGGQTLITCCEDEDISKRTGGRVLSVRGGRIR